MKTKQATVVDFDAVRGEGRVRLSDGTLLPLFYSDIEGVDVDGQFPPAHEIFRLERLVGVRGAVTLSRGTVLGFSTKELPRRA